DQYLAFRRIADLCWLGGLGRRQRSAERQQGTRDHGSEDLLHDRNSLAFQRERPSGARGWAFWAEGLFPCRRLIVPQSGDIEKSPSVGLAILFKACARWSIRARPSPSVNSIHPIAALEARFAKYVFPMRADSRWRRAVS